MAQSAKVARAGIRFYEQLVVWLAPQLWSQHEKSRLLPQRLAHSTHEHLTHSRARELLPHEIADVIDTADEAQAGCSAVITLDAHAIAGAVAQEPAARGDDDLVRGIQLKLMSQTRPLAGVVERDELIEMTTHGEHWGRGTEQWHSGDSLGRE